MKNLATKKESREYGALSYKFSTEEMISQLKVMHDNLNADIYADIELAKVPSIEACRLISIRTHILIALDNLTMAQNISG